ncbi:MAG: serine protease [Planctomycetaceae bacterium]|nr:serine protease [Planctomycetaceae bacterium]
MQDDRAFPAADAPATAAPAPHSAPAAQPHSPTPTFSAHEPAEADPARLRRLLTLFFALAAVLVAPTMAYRIQYAMTSAKERARYEAAKDHLADLNLGQLSQASRMLTNKVTPSVVSILTTRNDGEGQGSGVIVDAQGYIVTNQHVIDGVETVEVQLSDGRRGNASVIGIDRLIDVALLKTELPDLTPAEWGSSDDLEVGELVWAIGSPFGLDRSTTFGILSQKGRHGLTEPGKVVQEFLQTDAAVNPGNSGGPLVNSAGQVVGINTAIVGPSYQGISFAIPSDQVQESYRQLREKGHVERGYVGLILQPIPALYARHLAIEPDSGVFVRYVKPRSPAANAGIEAGDVILDWGGEKYTDTFRLSQTIAAAPAGATIPVTVLRDTGRDPQEIDLEVTLTVRPSQLDGP